MDDAKRLHFNGGPVHGAPRMPAVPINESVQRDFIICLEDGRRVKMLRRHLRAAHGLTPEQYRVRWGLPYDYPMVAPGYADGMGVRLTRPSMTISPRPSRSPDWTPGVGVPFSRFPQRRDDDEQPVPT